MVLIRIDITNMDHNNIIKEKGYCVFDVTKNSDSDSITPIDTKYIAYIICYEGEADLEINMQKFHIAQGECLCMSNVLYKQTMLMSDNFRAKVLICKRDFAFDSIIGIPPGIMESFYTNISMSIEDNNLLNITNNYLNNLDMLQDMNLGTGHNELVILSIRSIVLLLVMANNHIIDDKYTYAASEMYYRKFIQLIEDNIKQEHEVSFYAKKLLISPKYLSEVCKARSGHKAKEIISSFLISKIRQEILTTTKPIKTIAYEYGFADQSSLGKFFSKMTGQAPGDFRKTTPTSF